MSSREYNTSESGEAEKSFLDLGGGDIKRKGRSLLLVLFWFPLGFLSAEGPHQKLLQSLLKEHIDGILSYFDHGQNYQRNLKMLLYKDR